MIQASSAQSATAREPAPPPRELTRRAKSRAWNEPVIRFWWLASLVLLLFSIYFAIQQTLVWLEERQLIREGDRVTAIVRAAGRETITGKRVAPSNPAKLRFTYKEKEREVTGLLAGRKDYIVLGDPVELRIDPDHPEVWTARTEPGNLAQQLLGALLILPAAVIALTVSVWLRRRVLNIWRNGSPRAALVVDSRQTALAPLSRAVRCAYRDPGEKRLITVYVPVRAASLERGDPLWLVARDDRPLRALPAMLYE